jgi:hypothetical protein
MRVWLDRLYLLAGYAAGLFLVAIFVLMMFLSAGRSVSTSRRATISFRGAWSPHRSLVSPIHFATAR